MGLKIKTYVQDHLCKKILKQLVYLVTEKEIRTPTRTPAETWDVVSQTDTKDETSSSDKNVNLTLHSQPITLIQENRKFNKFFNMLFYSYIQQKNSEVMQDSQQLTHVLIYLEGGTNTMM